MDENDIITMMKKVFFINEIKVLEVEGGFETQLTNEYFVEEMARSIIRNFDKNRNNFLQFSEFKEVK